MGPVGAPGCVGNGDGGVGGEGQGVDTTGWPGAVGTPGIVPLPIGYGAPKPVGVVGVCDKKTVLVEIVLPSKLTARIVADVTVVIAGAV